MRGGCRDKGGCHGHGEGRHSHGDVREWSEPRVLVRSEKVIAAIKLVVSLSAAAARHGAKGRYGHSAGTGGAGRWDKGNGPAAANKGNVVAAGEVVVLGIGEGGCDCKRF